MSIIFYYKSLRGAHRLVEFLDRPFEIGLVILYPAMLIYLTKYFRKVKFGAEVTEVLQANVRRFGPRSRFL